MVECTPDILRYVSQAPTKLEEFYDLFSNYCIVRFNGRANHHSIFIIPAIILDESIRLYVRR